MARAQWTKRPDNWQSTLLAALCLLTLLTHLVRDLFIPETRDVEVWFGLEVRGTAALLTAPIHWAIFAAGAWGFWTQRPWVWTAASAYLVYGAFAHLIWSEASDHGRGWMIGLVQATLISAMAAAVWRMRPRVET